MTMENVSDTGPCLIFDHLTCTKHYMNNTEEIMLMIQDAHNKKTRTCTAVIVVWY